MKIMVTFPVATVTVVTDIASEIAMRRSEAEIEPNAAEMMSQVVCID